MPLWDWECPKCHKVEEKLMLSSNPPPMCTECDVEMFKLVSGNVSFRLYGEGFYNRTHKDSGDFS
jgi:putative FmdB family regulatory protein